MKDIRLVDGDVVFTADGNLETVESGACVAQDVSTAFVTTRGRLHWDASAGTSFPLLLNSTEVDEESVKSEAEDVLLADERIDPDSICVEASSLDSGSRMKLVAEFSVSGVGMERVEAELGGSA